jgi:hypothetical protein
VALMRGHASALAMERSIINGGIASPLTGFPLQRLGANARTRIDGFDNGATQGTNAMLTENVDRQRKQTARTLRTLPKPSPRRLDVRILQNLLHPDAETGTDALEGLQGQIVLATLHGAWLRAALPYLRKPGATACGAQRE